MLKSDNISSLVAPLRQLRESGRVERPDIDIRNSGIANRAMNDAKTFPYPAGFRPKIEIWGFTA